MAYYNKVFNLNKVTVSNKYNTVMSFKRSNLLRKKQYIEKHIQSSEIVISNRYAIANQICDPKRNFTEQKRCMDTWYELENTLFVKLELENLLRELDLELDLELKNNCKK